MSEILLPMFCSRIFMVLGLTLSLESILNLFLRVAKEGGLVSFFCTYLSNFPNTIVCACFLCQILTIKVWVYFWALYSVPLVCVSVFMSVPCCFDYYGLVDNLIPGSVILPTLFFFLRIAVAIWGLLWFHINFRNIYSSSAKDCFVGLWNSKLKSPPVFMVSGLTLPTCRQCFGGTWNLSWQGRNSKLF